MQRWLGIACAITLSAISLRAWRGSAPDERDPAQGVVWDLTPLFRDAAAWDRERQQVEVALPGLAALQGNRGVDPASLQSGLDRISAIRQRLRRVDAYARLKADEGTRVMETLPVLPSLDLRKCLSRPPLARPIVVRRIFLRIFPQLRKEPFGIFMDEANFRCVSGSVFGK